MRGAGDSKTPMYAMILTVVIDAIFNPLLIMGIGPFPQLGIAGIWGGLVIWMSLRAFVNDRRTATVLATG